MKKLSVIIPTLNEEDYLEKTIFALRNCSVVNCPKQIVIVDGGSKDHTRDVAQKLNVEFIEYFDAPKGRAYLLNKGSEFADGDVILFLDADSIVPEGYDEDIMKTLQKPNVVGGAFEFTLDGSQFGLRVVEAINRMRYRIWKRYYGDQGIFVKKNIFHKVGKYPQIGLMEASEFCLSLAKQGKLCLVKKPMLTSARRFLNYGIYRVLGFDIKMWWLNLMGLDVEKFANSYWKGNEKNAHST